MARESTDCLCPPRTPQCICGHHASLRLVHRGVRRSTDAEVARNPRARSARLRAAALLPLEFAA
jgi:16S rRNA (cytosine1402-N4)-methyltransferase